LHKAPEKRECEAAETKHANLTSKPVQ